MPISLSLMNSMFGRNCSLNVEPLTKAYGHEKHTYRFEFQILTLGWLDGSTFLPINSTLLSIRKQENRINAAIKVYKRSTGYKRRKISMKKGKLCHAYAFEC